MSARSRQQAIVKHLRSVGRAQVDELAVLFRATPQTIRKDLKVLATEGSALRFHGGASLVAGNEYTEIETRALIASANVAASPRFAIGKPSSTVACDADDPGIPINTDAKVSDVGTTANMPIISASPRTGSR